MLTQIYSEVKTFAESLGLQYLRASELEANYDLDNLDLPEGPIVIQKDRTEIEAEWSITGPFAVLNIPLELMFLQKTVTVDSKLSQDDLIVDAMVLNAVDMADLLRQSQFYSETAEPQGYAITREDSYKKFDAVFSGCILEFPFLYDKDSVKCP